ncbi:gluconokinase [Lentibacillus salinarum]|uniref:Gluconokinase n=1 Tax=Lentibacillus salinarum TaxID=446820 RepID=A0ABW3ZW67_9BACI
MTAQGKYYVGVDIGTTSTKAVLYTENGYVKGSQTIGYPLYTPNLLIAEQDPAEIFEAVLNVIRDVIRTSGNAAQALRFISFSSAMHSLIAVDEEGKLLTNSITWADTRSAEYAEKIKDEHNGHEIYRRTGTPIHAMSPLAKLVWLKKEKPNIFLKADKFISIKEFVFHQLFDRYVVDYSIASATGLFNLNSLDWDEGALELAGIDRSRLSEIVPTTCTLNNVRQAYREYMGIDQATPFVIGASDGVLSNLGVNAVDPGSVAVTIGTSGAIRTIYNEPKTDPKGRVFCYALTDQHWVIGGPVNNGGIVLRWLRDEFAAAEVEAAKRLSIDPYDVLTEIAASVNPGADGLIFHPYIKGERAPLWNANARGSFFGLGIHHQKQHLVRAVLEGIIYNLYTVLLALEELTGEPRRIQATGGFARSEMWRQMMANIFDNQVTVPESFESSSLGAVVLGMYATGEIDDFSVVSQMVGETNTHYPDEKSANIYRELLPIYIRLSWVLEKEHDSIAAFQHKHLLSNEE